MEIRILELTTCVLCPYYTCDPPYCHLSSKELNHEIGSDYLIPEWCTLTKPAPAKPATGGEKCEHGASNVQYFYKCDHCGEMVPSNNN